MKPRDCPECDHPFHGTDECEAFVDFACMWDDCSGDTCCEAPCRCEGVIA